MFVVPVSRRSAPSFRGLDRLFDSSFERFVNSVAQSAPAVRSPALDVSESDSHYTAVLDLPGVAKADLKIAIDGRRVTLETVATAKAETAAADAPATEAAAPVADRVIHRERAAVSYARSFVLPLELDQAASSAKLEDGVLTLTLVKRAPTATQLTVN